MCVCVCACVCVCVRVCVCACARARLYTHVRGHVRVNACMHVQYMLLSCLQPMAPITRGIAWAQSTFFRDGGQLEQRHHLETATATHYVCA